MIKMRKKYCPSGGVLLLTQPQRGDEEEEEESRHPNARVFHVITRRFFFICHRLVFALHHWQLAVSVTGHWSSSRARARESEREREDT